MTMTSSLFPALHGDKAANIAAAARALTPHLARSRTLDRRLISNILELCFNGSDADGAWTWRDAYDAVEAALVLHVRRLAPQGPASGLSAAARSQSIDLAPTSARSAGLGAGARKGKGRAAEGGVRMGRRAFLGVRHGQTSA